MTKTTCAALGLLLAAASPACSSKSDAPPPSSGSTATGGGSGANPGSGGTTGGGSNPGSGGTVGTGTTNSGPGMVSEAPGSCAKSDLKIFFSPMYSAFDGMHSFQVPAIVSDVASNTVTWSRSDPAMVGLQPDATNGGIMITMLKAGVVDIIATAPGGSCGVSKLTISQAEVDDWTAGDMRYNNGVVLARPNRGRDGGAGNDGGGNGDGGRPDGGGGRSDGGGGRPDGGGNNDGGGNGGLGPVADGGTADRLACTNCHGPTATNAQFRTVSHTPEQIGGFSDDDLRSIFEGKWPTGTGNPFDATIVSQRQWEGFHKWNMTEDEAAGVIIYLRALTPTPQMGMRNFGGNGSGRGDGGAGRPNDGGAGN